MDAAHWLEGLSAESPRARDLAAANLGDLLRAGVLDEATTQRAVGSLVALITTEPEHTVLEQALHSIGETIGQLPLPLVAPIADRMSTMDAALLEHALHILASTHDPAAAPVIDTYLAHPDSRVSAHAAEARQELPD